MTETRAGYQTSREERAMDTEIAEKIMGWHVRHTGYGDMWTDENEHFTFRVDEWNPSTNIADAMKVTDKLMADGWDFRLIKHATDRQWSVSFEPTTGYQYIDGWAETPAEAICLAALKVAEFREMMKAE